MFEGDAIYHHGRMALAFAIASGVASVLGIIGSDAFFFLTIGFALLAGWHVGNVLVRSL